MPIFTEQTRPVSRGSVHLDALRGAASLLVFLSHTRALYFSSPLEASNTGAIPPAKPRTEVLVEQEARPLLTMRIAHSISTETGGGVKLASEAVVIFFVLSGYLVGGSVLKALKRGRWSWREYLSKRITRLWIPLIPCLAICVSLDRFGFLHSGPGSIYNNPRGIDLITTNDLVHRLGLKVFLGNVCFVQGISVPYAGTDVSLWSLANEFWYYVAFPLAVLAVIPQRSLWKRVLYGALAIGIFMFTGSGITSLFPIWLLGAVVAIVPWNLQERKARVIAIGYLPLLFLCMLGGRKLPLSPLLTEYILAVTASVFLYLLVQQKSASNRSVYERVSKYFSEISYTLYIAHLPLAIFLSFLVNSPWHEWSKTPKNLLSFLLLDTLVLLCATLLWWFFEAKTDVVRHRIFDSFLRKTTC